MASEVGREITRLPSGALVRRMLAEDPFRTLRPEPIPDQRPTPLDTSVAHVQTGAEVGQPVGAGPQPRTSPLASSAGSLIGLQPAEPLSLRELEIRHIEKLLREHKNITMVAKLLDIDRRTLQRKLRSLGIDWRDE